MQAFTPSRRGLLRALTTGAFLLLFGWLCLSYWLALSEDAHLTLFMERDLYRASQIVFDRSFPVGGPETSGGGQTPGIFYYYLLALPTLLTPSLDGVLIFLSLLYAMTTVGGWILMRKSSGSLAAMITLVAFTSSYSFVYLFKDFWNPSFAPPFIVLFFALFAPLASDPLAGRTSRVFFLGIVCSLLAQLHVSFLAFFFALSLSLIGAGSAMLRWRRFGALTLGFALCYGLFYLPLVYYPDRSVNLETAPAFVGALRYQWKLMSLKLIPLNHLSAEDLLTVGTAIVLLFGTYSRRIRRLGNPYGMLLLASIGPALGFLIVNGGTRYGIALKTTVLFGIAAAVGHWLPGKSRGKLGTAEAIAVICLLSILLAGAKRPQRLAYARDRNVGTYISRHDMRELVKAFPDLEPLLSDHAYPPVYLMGVERFAFSWRMLAFDFRDGGQPTSTHGRVGWILLPNLEPSSSPDELLREIIARLPARFGQELEEGRIRWLGMRQLSRLTALSYRLEPSSSYLSPLNNIGLSYLDPPALPAPPSPGSLHASFANCGNPGLCSGVVELVPDSSGKNYWRIRVDGVGLRYGTKHIRPEWSEKLVRPYLEYRCGKATHRYPMAESLGSGLIESNWLRMQNTWKPLVSPFLLRIELKCGSISRPIAFGWESLQTATYSHEGAKFLPGNHLPLQH